MPEERNRIEVDRLAALLFAPEEGSRATLEAEGVRGEVEVVGDVMADANRRFAPLARERFPTGHEPGSYVVATIHREANVSQPRLGRILDGLGLIDEPVVFPAHPRTRGVDRGRAPDARPERGADRTARLPAVRVALVAGTRDRDRLRRPAEGGVLVRRPVRDRAPEHGVGRQPSSWARTRSWTTTPQALAAAVAAARPALTRPPGAVRDGHASERIAAALAARP
jgi:hypothetical protein